MEKDVDILVLTDQDSISKILQQEIKALGYRSIFSTDYKESIQSIRDKKIDLTVVHVGLEQKELIKVLIELKKCSPLLPMIFLTENNIPLIESSYEAGADLVMRAPFDGEALRKNILRLVEPLGKGKFRIHDRCDIDLSVKWRNANSEFKKSKILNLGIGGFFILENQFLPQKREIINFSLDYNRDGIKTVAGKAIVRWIRTQGVDRNRSGFGAEFLSINENLKKSLENLR